MPHLPVTHERDRLDPAVRMVREARLVVRRVGRLEVVEQQKRVQMIERARPQTTAQAHAGAFDDGLGLNDADHRTR